MKKLIRISTTIFRSFKRRLNKYIISQQLSNIGANCAIDEGVTIYGGENISIGNNNVINKDVILQSCEGALINIGNNVTISYGAKIITGNLALLDSLDSVNRIHSSEKIEIGNSVWIGTNVIILPGVIISNNIIIAAGSVVTKSLLDQNYIYAGIPAKKIKKICE